MRILILIIALVLAQTVAYAQTVEVKATTNKKEIDAILKKEREDAKINQAYFAEDRNCRGLIQAEDFAKAETSCRNAITLVEKLPKEHILERSSSRMALAVALLRLQKPEEAVLLLVQSVEMGKPVIDDSDAETGDRYLLLGHGYRMLKKAAEASMFYSKAEATFRTAFKDIGDDDLRYSYARRLITTLESHIALFENSGNSSTAETIRKRLAESRVEFSDYIR